MKITKHTVKKSCFLNNKRVFIFSSCFIASCLITGCAVTRAVGDTVEAVGVGVGQALTGVSTGTGHAVAGTGRAISRASGSNPLSTRPVSDNSQNYYQDNNNSSELNF